MHPSSALAPRSLLYPYPPARRTPDGRRLVNILVTPTPTNFSQVLRAFGGLRGTRHALARLFVLNSPSGWSTRPCTEHGHDERGDTRQ